jgi:metal-sulfur cluster biosynthetic enzyme
MEEAMKKKLANLLDRVKEPQSGLTLSQLGMVAGIKHEPITNKLIVVTDPLITSKACCMVFNIYEVGEIEDLISFELKKEFPDLDVEFVSQNS